jgi:hypothetical protein
MFTRHLLVSVLLAVGTIGVVMTPRPSAAAVLNTTGAGTSSVDAGITGVTERG